MAKMVAYARLIVGALALLFVVAIAAPAHAQQPSQVNPTASSVKEDQLLQQLNRVSGRCSIPDQKACTLEQTAGRSWREFHEITLPWIGMIAIGAMFVLLVLFYLIRGTVRIEGGRSGRTLIRFNAFERLVHWTVAVSFIFLAITGLNITFGKRLLLPLMSPEAFTRWSEFAKYLHNYMSFAFTAGVVLMALLWIWQNFPRAVDIEWLKKGGGIVGREHPPAWKFNAGQKLMFWAVIIGTTAVAVSGYMLMFPFYFTDIAGMQLSQVVHGIAALLFVAVILAHIYIGTLGMEGAFEAMGTGEVDLNWAKQHHRLWVERELAKGRGADAPARGAAATPAG